MGEGECVYVWDGGGGGGVGGRGGWKERLRGVPYTVVETST